MALSQERQSQDGWGRMPLFVLAKAPGEKHQHSLTLSTRALDESLLLEKMALTEFTARAT